ncbi:PQQ-binding-like beta-propeller repeat protein [Streptomyces sp. LHD-70]|uniref:outer membrane protein assembly factor BamB family protein n=1 Tax=Streptomyces sp. LHD-70 TaxID=3072140 RepID=UPI00280D2129|nr:PQQ-binding-like beta-propeller repeat protein [Streptomyces sp. LHD-70]MDQ8705089.1 PQQ-binding-like beta-propeller repeat protein [Streptomyces sp. LHD-70]
MPALIDDSLLVIPHGRKVSVVDTRDGRLLSQPGGSADEFTPVGLSGGVLFAVEQRNRRNSLTAYDTATGRKLWQRTKSPLARDGADRDWLRVAPILTDPGPVVDAAPGWVAGLAPRTGAVRWSEEPTALTVCPPPRSDDPQVPRSPAGGATADRLVLLRHCPRETAELHLFDAADGRLVRKKVGRWLENIRLQTRRETIGVTLDDQLLVYSASGRELLRRTADRGSELFLSGEHRGVLYLSERRISEGVSTLHAVRADTGKTLWTRPEGSYGGFRDVSGDVVVSGSDAEGAYSGDQRWAPGDARLQGPGASSLTDLDGRRTSRVPWPVSGTFVGVSGQLLVVRSDEKDGTRYTALRPGHRAVDAERPAALGGVARKDWPDACGLLGDRLLAQLGRDFVDVPVKSSRKVLGTALPHPSVCRFATASGSGSGSDDDDIFSVTVRWVAPDAKAARTYAANALPWGCSPGLGGCVTAEIDRPRGGVALYTYRTGLEAKAVAHATVVSGRHVFGVSSGTDTPRARELIRRVALHLSRYNETAPPS